MRRLYAGLIAIALALAGVTAALVLSSGPSAPAPVTRPLTPTQAAKTPVLSVHTDLLTPSTGVTLRASNGTWTNNPTSFGYLWEDCNSGGTGCGTAAGSPTNQTTYVVVSGDVGHTIRVVVTATNSAGSASQTSAATGVVTAPSGVLLFNGDFETPLSSGTIQPWNSRPQCNNYGAPTTTGHYPGDFYFDTGSSSSISPPGTATFNAASSATVPPLAGSDSGRIVLPTTASGHTLTFCTLNGLVTPAPGDLNTDAYYGIGFYMPALSQINSNAFQGMNMWEFHFNAVWGAPIAWQLHTGGLSNTNGSGNSVVLALETGACNASGSASPGCQVRSNGGIAACNITSAPNIGAVTCLPAEYAMPPGSVQYGAWNELVMRVRWASDTTGQIQTFYKTASSATWNTGANVTGIPTVQWNVATQGATCTTACGYPVKEDLELYGGAQSAPFAVNFDQQLIGTSLASVENALPTSGSTPIAPTNSVVPAVSGTTQQGSVLSATTGTWSGSPSPSFSYQWQDCNTGGTACTNIVSATASTYTLTSVDVGHTLRAVVTATNSAGTANATSLATATVTALSSVAGTGVSLAACTGSCTTPGLSPAYVNVSAPGSSCVGNGGGADQCPIRIFVPGNLVTTNVGAPVPLVIVFPDGTGVTQATGMVDWINLAASGKFIVVESCPSTSSCVPNDSEFRGGAGTPAGSGEGKQITAVISYMEAHYKIDANRIFATGGSKGGNAAFDAACDPTIEPLFAGVSAYSASAETAAPAAAPFISGACRAVLTKGTVSLIASPHPLMFQFVWSPQDTATRVNCWWEGSLPCLSTGAPSGQWFMPPVTTASGPGFTNEIWAPGDGCSPTPATNTYDSVSGGTGQLVSTTFQSCTGTLASGGASEVQAVQYTKSNGLGTCHWASCTQSVGSFSYNIATATWNFWTLGTTTPA